MKINTHLYLVYGVEVKNWGSCTFTPPYSHHGVMHDYLLTYLLTYSRVQSPS